VLRTLFSKLADVIGGVVGRICGTAAAADSRPGLREHGAVVGLPRLGEYKIEQVLLEGDAAGTSSLGEVVPGAFGHITDRQDSHDWTVELEATERATGAAAASAPCRRPEPSGWKIPARPARHGARRGAAPDAAASGATASRGPAPVSLAPGGRAYASVTWRNSTSLRNPAEYRRSFEADLRTLMS
jgi:hypothetical protein